VPGLRVAGIAPASVGGASDFLRLPLLSALGVAPWAGRRARA